ncbi:MAG: fluoride efflux transporter CrcB [Spirochaetales bacterium]|nr:fluoride efflux transporter CrcB [Spirochaetales bacterium]
MKNALAIAFGGSFGALSRYYLSKFIAHYSGAIFPWGTLAVNLGGSLLIGFFYGLFDKIVVPGEVRSFLMIGFLGAFTTFSTFALETNHLIRDGELKLGLLNIGISNIIGIICVIIGVFIAELITQK